MSAQPDHAPATPYAPAPGAPAELLAQLRADRRADRWVPGFEQEWTAALQELPVKSFCSVPEWRKTARPAATA
ncbi:hypothetical protein OG258_49255 [Streptomyces mirabilis]|uniref:hypothetical protein n=1 Tax=Streptomyces mirabilis TaxID=68239 RepID=UPI002E29B85C|nr:hypothetical protein [Streptomyces mirabilis]